MKDTKLSMEKSGDSKGVNSGNTTRLCVPSLWCPTGIFAPPEKIRDVLDRVVSLVRGA